MKAKILLSITALFFAYTTVWAQPTSYGGLIGTDTQNGTAGQMGNHSNSYFGYQAGVNNTNGVNNTFLGNNSGFFNNTGDNNIFVGAFSGEANTAGEENVFIGRSSGISNETGSSNVFIGDRSGFNNHSGFGNVFLGSQAGTDNNGMANVFIGYQAGFNNTGYGNVFLGNHVGYNENESELLYIDNSMTSFPLIWGSFASNELRFNGSVRITDISQNNVLTHVLVEDANGDIFWRDAASLGDGVNDADADPANEIELPVQEAVNANMVLKADGAGGVSYAPDNINDADSDPANEIQDLASVISQGGSAGSQIISNVLDPVLAQDAATKNYVDNISTDNLGSHTATQSINLNGQWLSGDGDGEGVYVDNEGDVSIGTAAPHADTKLDVAGIVRIGDVPIPDDETVYDLYVEKGILAEKIKIAFKTDAVNWSDYVFEEDYKLRSLSEVETFVKKNKHLPGIPSASAVEKEGIDVAQMDAKLLEKIEELVLYAIQQDKTLKQQQKLVENLLKRIEHLEK